MPEPPPLPASPTQNPDAPIFEQAAPPPHLPGTTLDAGQTVDDDQGRIFPCPACGADLTFHIGQQALKCSFCGHEEPIVLPEDEPVVERDFREMLAQLEQRHEQRDDSFAGMRELTCESCAGTVVFQGALTSTRCPYCASPIQINAAKQATHRINVDGVLPFHVDRTHAAKRLKNWVAGRWFAPNDFREQGIRADFNGVYLPYWTFDALTSTRYTGQRGETYTTTVGTGKNRRTVTRTNWYPAGGQFQRLFDDVLVNATEGLNASLVRQLEPWPLDECVAYNQQMLAGFLARTYEVELPAGFEQARVRIRSALEQDVRRRIGGDRQRIGTMDVRHNAVTFKHLLLPVWMMAYRYHDQPYRVYVNAITGEIQGERPYSWIKIALAILAGLIFAALAYPALLAVR